MPELLFHFNPLGLDRPRENAVLKHVFALVAWSICVLLYAVAYKRLLDRFYLVLTNSGLRRLLCWLDRVENNGYIVTSTRYAVIGSASGPEARILPRSV